MSFDFEALLEDPVYVAFALTAVLTVHGHAALTIDVLESTIEVEEAVAGGVVMASTKPAVTLRLSDLTAASLAREDMVKASLVPSTESPQLLGGVRNRVMATAPSSTSPELTLIVVEDP